LNGRFFEEVIKRFVLGEAISGAVMSLMLILSIGSSEVKSWPGFDYFRYSDAPELRAATKYVREQTNTSDDIYVWGYIPQFYLYAKRFSKFRHVNQLAMTGAYFNENDAPTFEPTKTRGFEEFQKYLANTPPEIFVVYDDPTNWKTFDQRVKQAQDIPGSHLYLLAKFIFGQLSQNYTQVFANRQFTIYRHNH